MQGPQGPAFRVEAAGFQGSFDRSVSRMHLRREPADSLAMGVRNQTFEQRSAYASVSPGVLYKHFHEVHRLAAVFRSPLVAGIGKPAYAALTLCHQDYTELWSLQYPLIDTLGVTRRSPRIPLVQ